MVKKKLISLTAIFNATLMAEWREDDLFQVPLWVFDGDTNIRTSFKLFYLDTFCKDLRYFNLTYILFPNQADRYPVEKRPW